MQFPAWIFREVGGVSILPSQFAGCRPSFQEGALCNPRVDGSRLSCYPQILGASFGDESYDQFNLWARVLDVPVALTQRSYGASGELTFTIDDDRMCPANNGTWLLRTDGAAVTCAATDQWMRPDGEPVTRLLYFTGTEGGAVWRNAFNAHAWKPALAAAGVIPKPGPGERCKEAREDGMHALRHFCASVLPDSRQSIQGPGRLPRARRCRVGFSLRTYTHLSRRAARRVRGRPSTRCTGRAVSPRRPPDGPRLSHPPLIIGKPLVRGIPVLSVDYFNQNWYQFLKHRQK
ncbi:sterol carrier protein domain-containing protein [Streptomyces sp. SS7]|uniref:sterol carrier protein domain-containing protein n=1 Tax=Streptomyces sp. SS7 TaxID=3108485 RepID=UPI0030EDA6E6